MVDMNSVGSVLGGMSGMVFDIILYVIIGLFFVGIIFMFLIMSKYNKRVVIRKKINGKNKIFYDKARLLKKDGVLWWKLLKAKDVIEVPPSHAVEVDRKGRDFVELYELETGEYIPLIDKHDEINSVQPFTTNQRQLLQGQFTKANLERGFKLVDYIGAITYVAALVILVLGLMVFYGDIAKPVLEMGDKQVEIASKQVELQNQLNNMLVKLNDMSKEQASNNNGFLISNSSRGVPN